AAMEGAAPRPLRPTPKKAGGLTAQLEPPPIGSSLRSDWAITMPICPITMGRSRRSRWAESAQRVWWAPTRGPDSVSVTGRAGEQEHQQSGQEDPTSRTA